MKPGVLVMDQRLVLFQRQYLQQLDNLTYPLPEVLLEPAVQEELSRKFFDDAENPYLPPVSYQRRVLKTLTEIITNAINDPEEDEISDTLMQQMAFKSTKPSMSAFKAAQQSSIVSYYLPNPIPCLSSPSPRVLISETRNLLAARGTTGLRVWDSCLHLATYLCSPDTMHLIKGKQVLELGAGAGLLSLVCAGHLQATSVIASDGDEDVVASIRDNAGLNAIREARDRPSPEETPRQKDSYLNLHAGVLDWNADEATLHEFAKNYTTSQPIDIILGADITYAIESLQPLISCLAKLNLLYPRAVILISVVIRNEETYSAFVTASEDAGFTVAVMPFDCPPLEEQTGLFHRTTPPMRILRLTWKILDRIPDAESFTESREPEVETKGVSIDYNAHRA